MRSEESRLLTYIGDRYNDTVRAGEPPADFDALLKDALQDVDVIGREHLAELGNAITERAALRANHVASVRRRIEKRWGKALSAYDECIAVAEEITSLLVDNAFREIPGEKETTSLLSSARRTTHFMTTRPTTADDEFADMFFWALRSLAMTTDVSARSSLWLTESYDDYLALGEIFRRTDKAYRLLSAGVGRDNKRDER